jgi:hypothetical protein
MARELVWYPDLGGVDPVKRGKFRRHGLMVCYSRRGIKGRELVIEGIQREKNKGRSDWVVKDEDEILHHTTLSVRHKRACHNAKASDGQKGHCPWIKVAYIVSLLRVMDATIKDDTVTECSNMIQSKKDDHFTHGRLNNIHSCPALCNLSHTVAKNR